MDNSIPYEEVSALGIKYFKSENYKEAINAFRKSILIKEDWRSYGLLGTSLMESNQPHEAIDAFRRSLAIREDWWAYQRLGEAHMKVGQYSAAIGAFKKSIEINNDSKLLWRKSDTYKDLGQAQIRASQYLEAIDTFKEAILMRPDWVLYQGLGIALFYRRNYLEAIDAFKQSIEFWENAEAYRGLALTLIRIKKYKEGLFALIKLWNINREKHILKEILNLFYEVYPKDKIILKHIFQLPLLTCIAKTKNQLIAFSFYSNRLHEQVYSGYINPLMIWCYSNYTSVLEDDNQDNYLKQSVNDLIVTKEMKSTSDNFAEFINSTNVLCFGESHGALFEGHEFIKYTFFGGLKASDINHENSSNHKRMMQILQEYSPCNTTIIFTCGEVDIRTKIHLQSIEENKIPELIVHQAIDNYIKFVDKILLMGYKVLINAPHGGGCESSSSSPMVIRNDLCDYFNQLLKKECKKRNILYATIYDDIVNPITRKNDLRFFRDNHHLHFPTNDVGKYLQSKLLYNFLTSSDKINFSEKRAHEIDGICKVLAGNIPGLYYPCKFRTNHLLEDSIFLTDNGNYYALIELPFPILVKHIVLEFEFKERKKDIAACCHAIYESCNQSITLEKNSFKGNPRTIGNNLSNQMKIEYDFLRYNLTNIHARYIFISILNASDTKLKKIGVTRMRMIEN